MNFRSCGDCGACCEGALVGNVYGNLFGMRKPCVFRLNNSCAIHKTRPQSCRNYQCAWAQYLFPEWMKPNLCGVMISVEHDTSGKQFLKVIELRHNISYEVYKEIQDFCDKNNTYYVRMEYNESVRQP
jgi:Fe-S-cluster containining protein